MGDDGAVVVVGGTRGIGFEIVRHFVEAGRDVVLTGQADAYVESAVAALDGRARGVTFDLARPATAAPALASLGRVRHLVLAAIDRDANSVKEYDVERALHLVTLKLVGYTEVVHTLLPRFTDETSLVLFGGMAKERPYPGSGIVGDSPFWAEKPAAVENYRSQTPTGRLATMADIVDATVFLLENPGVNGVDLIVDGGWHCR